MATTWNQAAPATTSLGRLIQGHRERYRLSQCDLARLADTDRSTITRIESGSRWCGPHVLARIADALQLGEVDRAVLMSHGGFIEQPIDELRAMQLCDYWLRRD